MENFEPDIQPQSDPYKDWESSCAQGGRNESQGGLVSEPGMLLDHMTFVYPFYDGGNYYPDA